MKRRIPSRLLGFSLAMAVLSVPSLGSAQDAVVDIADEKQTIRGFGGMTHPVWISDLTAAQRDTAFGNGDDQIGMTILRIHVDESQNNWSREVDTALRAQEHGAIVFASPWNPPTSMQVTVDGQRRLDPSKYGQYLDHLNAFVEFMATNGVDLYAISVQNEPDYAHDWTEWSPQEIKTFMVDFAGDLATRVIAPESFQYRKELSDPILNDPAALANMDILGAHLYGTQLSQFPYPLFKEKGAGKDLWMTEVYTDSKSDADQWPLALDVAYNIHNSMVLAEFNAYVWWYIRRSYGMIREDGEISKRGYCMAHYSKFVRPGFVRVEAPASPKNGVHLSAYKGDGQVVIVAMNRNNEAQSLAVDVAGSGAEGFERYTTSSSKNLQAEAAVAASGGTISFDLEPQSVTTLVGVDPNVDTGTGGDSGTGGDAATGGDSGTGGDAATGGDSAAGGSAPTGGAPGVGGTSTSGGSGDALPGSGGASSSGGSPGAGGQGVQPGSGGSGSGDAGANDDGQTAEDESGCSCSAAGASTKGLSPGALIAFLLGILALRGRRGRGTTPVSD